MHGQDLYHVCNGKAHRIFAVNCFAAESQSDTPRPFRSKGGVGELAVSRSLQDGTPMPKGRL